MILAAYSLKSVFRFVGSFHVQIRLYSGKSSCDCRHFGLEPGNGATQPYTILPLDVIQTLDASQLCLHNWKVLKLLAMVFSFVALVVFSMATQMQTFSTTDSITVPQPFSSHFL